MKNDTLVIKKRGEDGNKIITVRIKEDTLSELDRIAADPLFPLSREELEEMLKQEEDAIEAEGEDE